MRREINKISEQKEIDNDGKILIIWRYFILYIIMITESVESPASPASTWNFSGSSDVIVSTIAYPQAVIDRINKNYKSNPDRLETEVNKLKAIKIISWSPEVGNSIEVGDKKFSLLRPAVDNQNVFQWPNWSGNERFIKGSVVTDRVEEVGWQLFKDETEIRVFIDTFIPGLTFALRVQNFAALMWLSRSGYRDSQGGFRDKNYWWYACMTSAHRDTDDKEEKVITKDDDAATISSFGLGCALPVIYFKNT